MRTKLIVILTATAAAAIGAAAGIAQSGAISPHAPRAHTSAAVSTRVVVVRGPRGYRGRRGPQGPRGPMGPQGPAGTPGSDFVANLNINWSGAGTSSGHDTASVNIPGIGTLNAVCNTGQQTLQLVPADPSVRTVANISDFEGSVSSNNQPYSQGNGNPIVIASPSQPNNALPPNGMMMVTFSVQPVNGNGGPGPAPATLTLSSEYKVNDSDASQDFCYLAGQVIQGG